MAGAGQAYTHSAATAEANASGGSGALDVSLWRAAFIAITVKAFTGGTAPTITFFFEVQGADDIWYTQWSSAAIAAPGSAQVNLSDSLAETYAAGTVNAQHCVFPMKGRLRWAFGGTANPTSVTFSAAVFGRQ